MVKDVSFPHDDDGERRWRLTRYSDSAWTTSKAAVDTKSSTNAEKHKHKPRPEEQRLAPRNQKKLLGEARDELGGILGSEGKLEGKR